MMDSKTAGNVPQLDGNSMNVHEVHVEALRAVCPGVFTEGKVDFDKLAAALAGYMADEGAERYGLSWAGKPKCFAEIAKQTTGTLVPLRDESINFDTTDNVFIEGENLEVLKILQRSYYGKVKMIYIDPPYNTGKDFVYHDSFQRSGAEENEDAGLLDDAGHLKAAYKQNSKDSGRYHSNWLNMMYPRLYLARNLLRDDGVIFVSIDDNEVHNLRLLMNEIFGEENFLAQLTRKTKSGGGSAAAHFAVEHDYVVVYSRNKDETGELLVEHSEEYAKRYAEEDEKGKYFWDTMERSYTQTKPYKIKAPDGLMLEGRWFRSEARFFEDLKEGEVRFLKKKDGTWSVQFKQRKGGGQKVRSILSENEYKSTHDELEELGLGGAFQFPKPTALIKRCIEAATDSDDIILDFFAGSGTTAHAVMELNKEDGGNRKFICVQIPEETPEGSEARKAGYATIADITKARIRKVIERIQGEEKPEERQLLQGSTLNANSQGRTLAAPLAPLGFKVFKTAESNFNIWKTREFASGEELQTALEDHIKEVKQATPENKLYEILIKAGYDLNTKVETKKDYFVVNDGVLVVCLSEYMDKKIVDAIVAENPKQVISLDSAFDGKDELKVNMYLALRDKKIEFSVV